MKHPENARVIVTRIEDDGRSDYAEQAVERATERDADGNALFQGSFLWGTVEGTTTVGAGQNPDAVTDPFYPGPGGIRCVYFTFLPESEGSGDIERFKVSDSTQKSNMPSGFVDVFSEDRPGMHIHDSIDFVHVLSGEMYLQLDKREVLVRAGDMIVMRGAWHAWRNRGTEPCTVASILIGANRS